MVEVVVMKVVLAFSKTIIIEDIIEELPQYVTDKSFQDTMQMTLQSFSIKQWPRLKLNCDRRLSKQDEV